MTYDQWKATEPVDGHEPDAEVEPARWRRYELVIQQDRVMRWMRVQFCLDTSAGTRVIDEVAIDTCNCRLDEAIRIAVAALRAHRRAYRGVR